MASGEVNVVGALFVTRLQLVFQTLGLAAGGFGLPPGSFGILFRAFEAFSDLGLLALLQQAFLTLAALDVRFRVVRDFIHHGRGFHPFRGAGVGIMPHTVLVGPVIEGIRQGQSAKGPAGENDPNE
jgi:hypothetical protein